MVIRLLAMRIFGITLDPFFDTQGMVSEFEYRIAGY